MPLPSRVEIAYRASTAARGRASAPMFAIIHSRRWSWIRERRAVESGLDLTLEESPYPECVARAGDLHFVIDDNVPTNLGAGTNEDRIVIAPADVLALFVSPPTLSVNIQTSALGNMTATISGYQYAAFNAGRGIPAAVAIVSGTGLVGP